MQRNWLKFFSGEKNLLAFYWRLVLRPYLKAVIALFVLMLGVAVLDAATLGLGVPLLETATNVGQALQNPLVVSIRSGFDAFGWKLSGSHLLFAILAIASAVMIVRGAFALAQQYWTALIAKNLYGEVQSKLFEKTLAAPYHYLADKSRGALLYNVNMPSISVFQVISSVGRLFSSLLNVLCCVALMLYLSWWATLTIGVLGIAWVQGWRRIIDRRAAKVGGELYAIESQTNKTEVDCVDGFRVVKSYTLVERMTGVVSKLLTAQIRPHLRLTLLTHGVSFVNEVVASVVVVALGGVALVLQWGHMAFPQLVIFFVTLRRLSPLLAYINSSYAMLNKEKKGVEVIEEILHTLPAEATGREKISGVEEIALRNVHFSYPSNETRPVLDGVEIRMKKGEITAVVGPTGSGKSTLAGLLMGFYHPDRGSIEVNGIPFRALDLADWRRKIGFVSQDIFLFNDTIKNNIALWGENFSAEEIENAARFAALHDFIVTLPEGYETAVGDRGLKLSGGQAQRVAIARAILRKPSLLIFDEATSALDNLTEKAVYDAIQLLRQEAVVVVIAHRLSTIRSADQICVLRDGKIVEQGTHTSLIREGAFYAQLYLGQGEVLEGGAHA